MPTPYKNKEYIDFIREGEFLTDTALEGTDRVTEPFKVKIRDVAVLIGGIGDGADVIVEYSPDNMETRKEELTPATMRWFSRNDGTFNLPGTNEVRFWENIDAAEGWLRIRVANFTGNTDICVKTRPRIEFAAVV